MRTLVRLLIFGYICVVAHSETLPDQFAQPPIDTWPRTRWWWPGNAMTKEDITWQLQQMHSHGIGGVEQITMDPVYERGNHDFMSAEYANLVRHTVDTAASLGMSVSFNFGGPGWIFGGDWIPPEDQNHCLIAAAMDVDGGETYIGPLPTKAVVNPRDVRRSLGDIDPDCRVIAVVAARIVDGQLDASSFVDISQHANGPLIEWPAPKGRWRIMAFWLVPMGDGVVDHLNKEAMQRYCDHVGGFFEQTVGDAFGKTIDSFFSDSFEVPIHRNGIYWNAAMLFRFRERMGYDLTPYLPAIWYDIDGVSAGIRYDVNAFLHQEGMDAFFTPFLAWCKAHGVAGRIQPYGFVTDNVEGAGAAHIPEMEITAGEKDAVPWFDTRIGPRTYVASGAHLYGRNIVSTEAYTYLHWERYRETPEELKIAGDMYLIAGANRFYNHGYLGTPERSFALTRDFSAAIHIDHSNPWWRYYPHVSQYLARCCLMLQQGRFVADVAVYSPLANQWTLDALNARRWTRDFDWGDLGRLLWANGYNFDLVNDDILQNHATFDGQSIAVGDNRYSVLILPRVHALPLQTLRRIEEYASRGGIVIAVDAMPGAVTGLHPDEDAMFEILNALLPIGGNARAVGKGVFEFVPGVMDRSDPLDRHDSAEDPFLNTLRRYVTPDFAIDFAAQELRENYGLVFNHRTTSDRDIYFVANVQDRPVDLPVTFRILNSMPHEWNPLDGSIRPLCQYRQAETGTEVPLHLGPFASTFVVFEKEAPNDHVESATLDEVTNVDEKRVEGWTRHSGHHQVKLAGNPNLLSADVDNVPAPFIINGSWQVTLRSEYSPTKELALTELASWTSQSDTRNFSGTGEYRIPFELPEAYVQPDVRVELDLGKVGTIAEVALNGKPIGVRWYGSQTLDATPALKAGKNELVVQVTNTLINHVASFETAPPVPDELVPRLGQGLLDKDSTANALYGFEPLPVSGLVGPVRLIPLRHVEISRE